MENAKLETSDTKHEADAPQENSPTNQSSKIKSAATADGADKTSCCKKHTARRHKSRSRVKTRRRAKKHEHSSDSDSDDSSSSSSSSSSSDASDDSDEADSESDSDDSDERRKKRRKARAKSKKQKDAKRKKKNRSKKLAEDSSSEDSTDTEEADESSANEKAAKNSGKAKAKAKARARKAAKQKAEHETEPEEVPEGDPNEARLQAVEAQLARLGLLANEAGTPASKRRARRARRGGLGETDIDDNINRRNTRGNNSKKHKRASKVAFKRVDQLWDSSIHNYKLTETVDDPDADEWDQYIFTVRRQFDWEHKYESTSVDVRSKPLKDALQHVMEDVKGVSLVQDTPQLDPNLLFHFLEEIRSYTLELKAAAKKEKKNKARKAAATKAQHLKVLLKYLDKDFADTKKALYPLLENEMITFDLLWALFKPNIIAFTPTYNDNDQPRAFKLEYANLESSIMNGTWYSIEGRYLEYDGKVFGMGNMHADVPSFKGSRKISSLACYPLKYHKNVDELKAQLIERGKKFVTLKGMNYRFHEGMAYVKKKRAVLKININGRIMVDPAIHRRINPNYQVSTVRPKEDDEYYSDGGDSCSCCGSSDSSDRGGQEYLPHSEDDSKSKRRFRTVQDENGDYHVVEVNSDNEDEGVGCKEKIDSLATGQKEDSFTDDELLIASPVVLGFAFSEKLWLEFTVSGIRDVEWNEGAYDSLVLPENHKSIVKSLVTSHKFSAAKNIDDVISGKGKGLVAVLHGPPGTGKTLTAEGIAELLKCPLYMVSAGELGTDSRVLERTLTDILDIAHAWGAVLLLDEADVFLEKRSIHDIHRNALVSIFLRLLEYFQGILFLTTNRVETFDDAFQSRIHVALKYGALTTKAKKSVWKMFIDKVRQVEGVEVADFRETDFDTLAKQDLNGRQIKNSTHAAQALALNEQKPCRCPT